MLAVELLDAVGDDWRCAAGEWHYWDGTRWLREQTRLIWDRSRHVCREVAALIDDKRAAQRIASSQAIHAAVRLAEADRKVAMEMSLFDGDRWLLNTPDGVVNLKSGQLGPHDRAALMTKIAGAGPMAEGDCAQFLHYLSDATGGDKQLMRYLQRVAGYCLTGSIEEHCILFFHGPGGSGKTTFLLVIQDLLGDYAVNSPMNAFTVSTGERHPTELAHFFGARVVTASEIEEGMRWDEGKLKAISGGDKITARYMRGDFFTFEPQFKLLLAGNHRPRMRSADDAMRRRMQVIPFRYKPSSVDKGLREKLQGELGAILRWAIEGEAERRRLGGLAPPRVVVEATNEYFKSENTIGRWLDERCEVPPEGDLVNNYWDELRHLYRDFAEWAKRVGEFVISERIFSQKLEQMPGITKALHPRTRRSGFAGLRLYSGEPQMLPGLDGDKRDGRIRREGVVVNEWPLTAPDDPGDEYER
jgi:putative DNA primase/helicase